MEKPNFAVFVDLENAGAKVATLNNIIEKVKIRGNILLGKVYGYTDHFSDLNECLLSNTFDVVPSIRYGKAQKNNLDIRLVIDAMEVAYINPLIDSFCIVSGDSDYTPLVGKLRSMGKHVIGISRSEAASGIFIKACNEFIFLETVSVKKKPETGKNQKAQDDESDIQELAELVETILSDRDEDAVYASELKDTLTRLRPDFDERSYGFTTFGKLLNRLSKISSHIRVWTEESALKAAFNTGETDADSPKLNKSNWLSIFQAQLEHFKQDGFDRINPSILKNAIQADYPDFDEHSIGFKRFSDVMKRMEKEGLLKVEMDESRTMLIKIL